MMRQLFDSPIVQSLFSNPETLRDMIMNHPQMQQIMEVGTLSLHYLSSLKNDMCSNFFYEVYNKCLTY